MSADAVAANRLAPRPAGRTTAVAVAAVLSVEAGLVHLWLVPSSWATFPEAAVLFAVAGVAQVVFVPLLVRDPRPGS